MSTVFYSTAHICRICERETDQNDLKSNQNIGILKRLRSFADISVSFILC